MISRQQRRDGFTIVELLIVIVVIGILAAITIVAYNGIQQRANDSVLAGRVSQIKKSIELYYVDNQAYPKSSDWGARGLNDFHGKWPINNMTGISADTIISPYDTSGDPSSMSELTLAKENITYVSVIASQAPSHWTCYTVNDDCVGYRLTYVKGNGDVVTAAGGENVPSLEDSTEP